MWQSWLDGLMQDVSFALELGRGYDASKQEATDIYNEMTAGANRK
ncbi:MAG: hypothetical protein QF530_10500 [SAR202 cluster bacterium]|nr:hypothetical protein [SAR202 cluster bacterium]